MPSECQIHRKILTRKELLAWTHWVSLWTTHFLACGAGTHNRNHTRKKLGDVTARSSTLPDNKGQQTVTVCLQMWHTEIDTPSPMWRRSWECMIHSNHKPSEKHGRESFTWLQQGKVGFETSMSWKIKERCYRKVQTEASLWHRRAVEHGGYYQVKPQNKSIYSNSAVVIYIHYVQEPPCVLTIVLGWPTGTSHPWPPSVPGYVPQSSPSFCQSVQEPFCLTSCDTKLRWVWYPDALFIKVLPVSLPNMLLTHQVTGLVLWFAHPLTVARAEKLDSKFSPNFYQN